MEPGDGGYTPHQLRGYSYVMEHLHQRFDSRTAPADCGAAAETAYGWRGSLNRLHKNPIVRKHVRYWLLGLMSFGPIR